MPFDDTISLEEIDSILASLEKKENFNNIEELKNYLISPELKKCVDPLFGVLDNNASVLSFFKNGNISLLNEIKALNECDKMGNVRIPETEIELINYSICPKCGRVYSFKKLTHYFLQPVRYMRFKSKEEQSRNDTVVKCSKCGTRFVPALVICDKEPVNECQFLCRAQTVTAVEQFYREKFHKKVLSENPENIVELQDGRGILNDTNLYDLKLRPTLMVNMLQYTPCNLVLNLITGTNIPKQDLLFGAIMNKNTVFGF